MNRDFIRAVQLEALEVLKELDRVCRKMGIVYFITAGTLLGAVRHQGFIPWDDDVDVVMFREDYERFSGECHRFVSKDFYYQDYRSFSNYPMGFSKLRKKDSSVKERLLVGINLPEGAFVDIFPLDICPDNSGIAKLFFMSTNILNAALLTKAGGHPWNYGKKRSSRLAYHLVRQLPFSWQLGLRTLLRKTAALFGTGNRLCTVSGRHGYPKESYERSWFSQPVLLHFEGHAFPAPLHWERLLERMYGDYMTPKKEENHIE